MRILMATLLLALPALAVAQGDQQGQWRASVSWVDMGDFGDGPGLGVDYLLYFGQDGIMASLEWADVRDVGEVTNRFGAALGYVRNLAQRDNYQPYLGLAVVYSHLTDGDDDGCVGGRVFGGATLSGRQRWFLQFGYDFGTDLFAGADINGPRFSVGLSF